MVKIKNCTKYLIDNFDMPPDEARKICATYTLPWKQDAMGLYIEKEELDKQGKYWVRDQIYKWRKKGLV